MVQFLADPISTRLQPGVAGRKTDSRFNGFGEWNGPTDRTRKPLKRLCSSTLPITRLKPGANEMEERLPETEILFLTLTESLWNRVSTGLR